MKIRNDLILIFLLITITFALACNDQNRPNEVKKVNEKSDIIFAAYAETDEQLRHIVSLAESVRAFGGQYKEAVIWAYIPEGYQTDERIMNELAKFKVGIKTSTIPDDAEYFYYSGKVFAAGLAEKEAEDKATILVWMDEDTIVLQEPVDFKLEDKIGLAYRPVMHNRSGSLYGEPPGKFWGRVYEKLALNPDSLFSMVTPADKRTIRAYFNAGLLVVRPEHKILRKWQESYKTLYHDSVLAEMCRAEVTWRIFLHQAALVGAIMHSLSKNEMIELSDNYNYPIFFKKMYGAESEFDSIENVVTLRYDIYFRKPDPDWSNQLTGPADRIDWLRTHLGYD